MERNSLIRILQVYFSLMVLIIKVLVLRLHNRMVGLKENIDTYFWLQELSSFILEFLFFCGVIAYLQQLISSIELLLNC